MRIQSIRAGLIVAIATLVLSGCGRQDEPSASRQRRKSESEAVRLSLWHIMHYSGPREVLQQATERFQKGNPGTAVEVLPIKNDEFKTKLQIEMASGSPPDIFHTWGGGKLAFYAGAGRLLDLTERLKKDGWGDTFSPMALDFCRVNGRVFAVPLDLSAVVLWYNAKLFAEHGLTPATDWQAFLNLCRTLRQKGIVPLALGNRDQWPGAFYFIYLANRLGGTELFEGAAARRPGFSFADPAFVKAGELLRNLVEIKAFPVGFNGLGADQARRLFFTGRAAMMLTGTWLVARCKKDAPDLMPYLKCAAFPSVKGGKGDPATVVGGTNAAFAVTSRCAHPEKAVELLRFLTSPEIGRAWVGIGRMTAILSAEDSGLPAPTQEAANLLRAAKSVQLYYDQYLPPPLATMHKETTQAIFTGNLTPPAAAQKMEALASRMAK